MNHRNQGQPKVSQGQVRYKETMPPPNFPLLLAAVPTLPTITAGGGVCLRKQEGRKERRKEVGRQAGRKRDGMGDDRISASSDGKSWSVYSPRRIHLWDGNWDDICDITRSHALND